MGTMDGGARPATIDTINPHDRDLFIERVRTFLNDDLLTNHTPWDAGNWNRQRRTYQRVFHRTLSAMCGLCQLQVLDIGINIRFTKESYELPPAEHNTYVQQQIDTQQIAGKIQACAQDRNVRCILMKVEYTYTWNYMGHTSFVLFDTHKKIQIPFDPHDGLSAQVSHIRTLCSLGPLLPGYRVMPAEACTWANKDDCIQEVFQHDMTIDEKAQCGILVQLVALCCLRFRYLNPKGMADILIAAYPTHPLRKVMVKKLIRWYDDIIKLNRGGEDNRQKFVKKMLPDSTIGCSCVSPQTGRMCRRKSCKDESYSSVYCWQHRHIIMNPVADSKKCNAPLQLCYV